LLIVPTSLLPTVQGLIPGGVDCLGWKFEEMCRQVKLNKSGNQNIYKHIFLVKLKGANVEGQIISLPHS